MLFVHQANIERYETLLATSLSNEERLLIECRMTEEKNALSKLTRHAR